LKEQPVGSPLRAIAVDILRVVAWAEGVQTALVGSGVVGVLVAVAMNDAESEEARGLALAGLGNIALDSASRVGSRAACADASNRSVHGGRAGELGYDQSAHTGSKR